MAKWHKILTKFVMQAVEQVKPSSRLNISDNNLDSLDINSCIKIKIIDWADCSRCQYVNGFVMTKTLADRFMKS